MNLVNLLGFYWLWHYTDGVRAYVRNYLLVIKFFINYFSIDHIIKTLFLPIWTNRFRFSDNFISKIFLAIIGIILKSLIFLLGIGTLSLVIIGGVFVFILWFFVPLALVIFYILGFIFIFRSFL